MSKIIKNREGNGILVVEVEIVGKIEKQNETEYGVLATPPPFVIKANQMKQNSPISFVNNKEIQEFRNPK